MDLEEKISNLKGFSLGIIGLSFFCLFLYLANVNTYKSNRFKQLEKEVQQDLKDLELLQRQERKHYWEAQKKQDL